MLRWGLTSAGRVMVISDAPVGADLSEGPQAMWPDKPLAPESVLLGRTQLAPDRPPLSLAQPPCHSQNPVAAATLTSPPGATATSYRSNTQTGTHFWESGNHAENLYSPTKVTEIHIVVSMLPRVLGVCSHRGKSKVAVGVGKRTEIAKHT